MHEPQRRAAAEPLKPCSPAQSNPGSVSVLSEAKVDRPEPKPPAAGAGPRSPGLDVLRFVAVSLVKSLAWLGKHSYSVYLWHVMAGSWLFVLVGFRTHNLPGWLLNVLIYFTLCWTVGILMARLVEFPVLQIRDRLFPGLRLVKLN